MVDISITKMNTISTYSYRRKYALAHLAKLLRKKLVAEKVCKVDRSGLKYIDSPYGSQPSTTVQTIAGTYTPASFTLTDDGLTVTDEFIVSEHIYDFEETLTKFNVFRDRIDELNNSAATALDKWVINELCENANGTYSTPSGGFTTAANVIPILSNLLSKVVGYDRVYGNVFLIIENTDLPGLIQAFGAAGFNTADAWLNNGYLTSQMGIDFYIVRTGTFADATTSTASGTKTWTNSGHRVFGVKGVSTYAFPTGMKYEEKGVTGKTGKEVVVYGYAGFKAWVPTYDLLIDITIA